MSEKYTPMMEQYLSVKKNLQDTLVFYRIGDFYEMFFDDAKIASKELDLILTGKNAGVSERVPMCGIPHHASEGYIQRLVQKGYKVAIVEQVEDPKDAVGIVKRDVIRIVTPGTMNDANDEKKSIFLGALSDYGYGYCLCYAEVSTGENAIMSIVHDESEVVRQLLRLGICEAVIDSTCDEALQKSIREQNIVVSYCDKTDIDPSYQSLCVNLSKDYELTSYGRLLNYLTETQKHLLLHLEVCRKEEGQTCLKLDYGSLQNLEITSGIRNDVKGTTLWSFMDICKSAMGSRLLKHWLEKPLYNREKIIERYDKVQYFIDHFMIRQALREDLAKVYDLSRLTGRIAMQNASPIDFVRLMKTLKVVPAILDRLDENLFGDVVKLDRMETLCKTLESAFDEEVPSNIYNGNVFKDGYNKELDEVRVLQRSGQEFILNMEAKEREKTGIKTLKIGYNKVFGYYIEISKGAAKEIDPSWNYHRKQTLTTSERFISDELKEKEEALVHASEKAIALEKELYRQMIAYVSTQLASLQRLSKGLSEIDVLSSFAELASKYGYVRPVFSDDVLNIEQGKHPILDVLLKKQRYIPNNTRLDKDNSILLITGPNMGGKSTYMRQTALLVIMAQAGSYVPCKKMELPLFDAIYTRIGASDNILEGQSTFMVEMIEANHALSEASDKSLILFDEIGRGTSTYDGMALAQAMMEYIASCIKAKTLFSTHYHELTTLTDSIGCASNVHVGVKEENDHVTFLYKIQKGAVGHSYGVNVARLAGLPDSVIERAKMLQKELESKKRVVQQSYQLIEMTKEDPRADKIKEMLETIVLDDMSPRQAWDMLADLQKIVKEKS